MKIRGIRNGMLVSFEASDNSDVIENISEMNKEVFAGNVTIEVDKKISWSLVEKLMASVKDAGGEIIAIKPSKEPVKAKGKTVILEGTIRSGAIIESTASIIVLGDVNSGAELVAEDDIIVVGSLRGLAHAGVSGNKKATIWSKKILSPQLRIADAVAQADGNQGDNSQPEIAFLHQDQIAIRAWK